MDRVTTLAVRHGESGGFFHGGESDYGRFYLIEFYAVATRLDLSIFTSEEF